MGVPQVMVRAEGNGSLGATLPQGVKDPSIPRIVDSSSWVISDFESCHGWFSAALVVQLQRDKRGSLWPAPALPIVITLPLASRSLLPCLCCVEYPYIHDELLKRSRRSVAATQANTKSKTKTILAPRVFASECDWENTGASHHPSARHCPG